MNFWENCWDFPHLTLNCQLCFDRTSNKTVHLEGFYPVKHSTSSLEVRLVWGLVPGRVWVDGVVSGSSHVVAGEREEGGLQQPSVNKPTNGSAINLLCKGSLFVLYKSNYLDNISLSRKYCVRQTSSHLL